MYYRDDAEGNELHEVIRLTVFSKLCPRIIVVSNDSSSPGTAPLRQTLRADYTEASVIKQVLQKSQDFDNKIALL